MICILMAHIARREAPGNMYSTTTCCKCSVRSKLSIFKNIVTDGEWNPETPVVRIGVSKAHQPFNSLSTIREERRKQRLYNANGRDIFLITGHIHLLTGLGLPCFFALVE